MKLKSNLKIIFLQALPCSYDSAGSYELLIKYNSLSHERSISRISSCYNFTIISYVPDLSEDSLKRIYEHLYRYHVKVFYKNNIVKSKLLVIIHFKFKGVKFHPKSVKNDRHFKV